MRIALVSQEYPPGTARGGIGTQTYLKATGLTAKGHRVFVISRGPQRSETEENGVRVIRIPGLEDEMPEMTEIVEWITHSVVVAAELQSLAVKESLDIIDFPEWGAEGYVYLLNRTEWSRVPAVVHLHGPMVMLAHSIGYPDPESDFYRVGTQMEAKSVQLADAVYSSSACSAKWVRDNYQMVDEIPIIHLGINTDEFFPRNFNGNNSRSITFVGKIVTNKGVEELVTAAGNLTRRFPDLKLRLIGNGEPKVIERLTEIASRYQYPDFLEFVGFLNRDRLPEELSRADIFAAPSYYEGGPGFVYLEAMSCGIPVVGCSGSGVDEIVQHGVNGMLVPPRDARSLESVLGDLLTNDQARKEMGVNAREFVLQNADSSVCLDKLEAFYEAVIASARKKEINFC